MRYPVSRQVAQTCFVGLRFEEESQLKAADLEKQVRATLAHGSPPACEDGDVAYGRARSTQELILEPVSLLLESTLKTIIPGEYALGYWSRPLDYLNRLCIGEVQQNSVHIKSRVFILLGLPEVDISQVEILLPF